MPPSWANALLFLEFLTTIGSRIGAHYHRSNARLGSGAARGLQRPPLQLTVGLNAWQLGGVGDRVLLAGHPSTGSSSLKVTRQRCTWGLGAFKGW